MSLSFFLARRFLFSRHRSGFVRLLTYLSVGSVGLTFAAFVIVMAVMNGFDRDLQTRIISSIGAIRGFSLIGAMACTPQIEKTILETPGVSASTPEVRLSALLRAGGGPRHVPITAEADVTAVSIERKIKTSPLEKQLVGRSLLPDLGEILLGAALAEKLSVEPGDTIEAVLLFPSTDLAHPEGGQPVETKFRVSGVYRTGYYEIDATAAILPIESVRRIFGIPEVLAHNIEIAVIDREDVESVNSNLSERLLPSGLYFRTWRDMREPLFRAVNLEKRVMAMILSLFGLVAAFSVFSALTATSVEKRLELAALRAMGMGRRAVSSVLIYAGCICGGLGLLLGGALAIAGHLLITRSGIFRLPSDIYDLDRLPSEWSTPLFAQTACVLFALSVLAAIIPAVLQAQKSPSAALREE